MPAGYWHSNYWHANYWHANYWAPPGSVTGDYWHDNYWHANYWHANYWAKVDTGDVQQQDPPNLPLATFVTQAGLFQDIQADTENLPLVAFQADANLDIDPPVTTAVLPLNAFNASIGVEGYQLGDIDLRWNPDSSITITYGFLPATPNVPLGPMVHTIEEGGGVAVAASLAAIPLNTFSADANLNVDVEPLPASLPLNAFNTTAGIGVLIPATSPNLPLTGATHTIEGLPQGNDVVVNNLPGRLFNPLRPNVFGRSPDVIPPGDFTGDLTILNDNAAPYPSQYEICDRTGFRLRRGHLKQEWTGLKVREQSWEKRNTQDFVRGVGDDLEGSPRPEKEDRFIEERVLAEDL